MVEIERLVVSQEGTAPRQYLLAVAMLMVCRRRFGCKCVAVGCDYNGSIMPTESNTPNDVLTSESVLVLDRIERCGFESGTVR